jgi:hypothetical protein
LLKEGCTWVPPGVIKVALAWPASTLRSGGGDAPLMSPVLYVGVLVFIMSPMADGVGVNGGGFSALFETRGRLLLGVTGGGIVSLSTSSLAMASIAASSVGADFFCLLRGGCADFGGISAGASGGADVLTRADRRNDIVAKDETLVLQVFTVEWPRL